MKPRVRWVCSLVVMCVSLLSPMATAEDVRPATVRTEQVLKGLEDLNNTVRKWCIEYEAVVPSMPFYIHRTLAARFPDSCLYRGAKGPADPEQWRKGTVNTNWKDHPFQDWVLVTSKASYWGKPWNREYGEFSLEPKAPLPPKMRNEVLFFALGWWTFQERPAPRLAEDIPCSIPDIVGSGRYSIAPRQALRSGIWCHVLENAGRDRIWIDCERPFTIIAREIADSSTGATITQVEMSGHREDQPGIWVPREIHYIEFNHRAPTSEGRQERVTDSQTRIVDVRLNGDVDETLFQPAPLPPGALRDLPDGRYEQAVPGGFDQMDHLAAALRSWNTGVPPETDRSATLDYAVMAIAAVILTILGCWRVSRRLWRASTGSPAEVLSVAGDWDARGREHSNWSAGHDNE